MIDPLADHPLLEKLGRIMGAVIEETSEQRGGEFVQVREYLPHEDYGRITLLATAEVQATLTQLTQATLFMANFRSTQQLKTHGISRFDHIVYHLENFLVRITGAFDRCLILVNVALDLGNEPEDCRYSLIKKNKHAKGTGVLGPLAEINSVVKPYREQRDIVAHRKRYSENQLHTLEMFHVVSKVEPNEKWSHLAKQEADRVVSEKKKEMNDSNKRLQAAISRLFDNLEPVA